MSNFPGCREGEEVTTTTLKKYDAFNKMFHRCSVHGYYLYISKIMIVIVVQAGMIPSRLFNGY